MKTTYYLKQYWNKNNSAIYYEITDDNWRIIRWSHSVIILSTNKKNAWETVTDWCDRGNSGLYNWKVLTKEEAFVEML